MEKKLWLILSLLELIGQMYCKSLLNRQIQMPPILLQNEINFPGISSNLFETLEIQQEEDNYINNWSFSKYSM